MFLVQHRRKAVPGVPDDDLTSAHRPAPDDWRCPDDGEDWPCAVFRRRVRLLYPGEPDRLAAFMRHFRDRAAPALPELTPEQIQARFVGWINDPPVHRRLRSI
ncbi:hypothetical protein OG792_32625 [Micromonospora sp. NBC_01699]|uniref:hypothetical protein n=1 Tax=Micromonospora sp. NBC_01699 TaxID=2975984 RepID=UPI002E298F8C|nr:hypothetical protein [Micromonospora sp. NBC_01699]